MSAIGPQPGPQEQFLSSPADIVIYGGAAGGGKTYALLLEALRHIGNPRFGAVIFRKNANQIFSQGGLWDTAAELYLPLGARSTRTPKPVWRFPSGAKVGFAHLEYEKDLHAWQGSQIPLIGFDELTHFSQKQFFYMLSRNRSPCGVRPYVRATTNPDGESWVADFLAWWWDPQTGYPIPERGGVIRYLARVNDTLHWGGTPEELAARYDVHPDDCKSVTFIPSSVEDNRILMERDPGYLSNLKALALVERERLLKGNWKIKPAAGLYFRRSQIPPEGWLEELPHDVTRWVRCWDLAASEADEKGDPAYTAGILMGRRKNGRTVIADATRLRASAGKVRDHILATAKMDKKRLGHVKIRLPQDPGQAGKGQAQDYIKFLSGFPVTTELESGSKLARAEPFAAQWQHGNVDIVLGSWNEDYLNELEAFPEGKFKDQTDASANGFLELQKPVAATPPAHIGNMQESYWKGR